MNKINRWKHYHSNSSSLLHVTRGHSVDGVFVWSVDPSVKGHWLPHSWASLWAFVWGSHWFEAYGKWNIFNDWSQVAADTSSRWQSYCNDICDCVGVGGSSVWLTRSLSAILSVIQMWKCVHACVFVETQTLCESTCHSTHLRFTTGHKHLQSAVPIFLFSFSAVLLHMYKLFLAFCSFSNWLHFLHFLHSEPTAIILLQ